MTVALAVEAQYSRGDLRNRIENALRAAGKNPERLSLDDLAPLDEFHLLGRSATRASPTSPGSPRTTASSTSAPASGTRTTARAQLRLRGQPSICPPSTAQSPNG
jgi:hypothetical protein